jgi:N-acetylglucosaminyldiphosphoundecaprenol N-acetyl-beta-D-mannosaminyltransferase
MEQALLQVQAAVAERRRLHIGVVNAAKIVNMRSNPALRESVLASDAIYADGMSVVWASRFLGRPLPERIAGIDLMHGILEAGAERGLRVYCLGAKRDVVGKVAAEFARRYPGVDVVGTRDGYFTEAEEESVATEIRDARPDVLFVAITSPKKENFMARWSDVMAVPVVHGVGGSFDVVAGLVERAPERWQRLGLEWLYRVLQEPGRLWKRYLVTNTLFLGLTLRERFRRDRKS